MFLKGVMISYLLGMGTVSTGTGAIRTTPSATLPRRRCARRLRPRFPITMESAAPAAATILATG
jgi:hypothetical protein